MREGIGGRGEGGKKGEKEGVGKRIDKVKGERNGEEKKCEENKGGVGRREE